MTNFGFVWSLLHLILVIKISCDPLKQKRTCKHASKCSLLIQPGQQYCRKFERCSNMTDVSFLLNSFTNHSYNVKKQK